MVADNWKLLYQTLRPAFCQAATELCQLQVALAYIPNADAWEYWQRVRIWHTLARDNQIPGRNWKQHGLVWGDAKAVDRYYGLAKTAANGLPADFRPKTRLFPSDNPLSNANSDPVTIWNEFLYLTQITHFTVETDWPVPGSRIAMLRSDPFFVSTTAIDSFLLGPTEPSWREYRELLRQNGQEPLYDSGTASQAGAEQGEGSGADGVLPPGVESLPTQIRSAAEFWNELSELSAKAKAAKPSAEETDERSNLPDTPEKLRERCEELRRKLHPDEAGRQLTLAEAPKLVGDLWHAMRSMGGQMPDPPEFLKRDLSRLRMAFLRRSVNELPHISDVDRAINAVVNWCAERLANEVKTATDDRATAGKEQGEGNAERTDAHLRPSREKAYALYLWAMKQEPALKTDQDAYKWLQEHEWPGEHRDSPAEKLPSLATWSKYLREARAYHQNRKNSPRKAKMPSGKSVVRREQI